MSAAVIDMAMNVSMVMTKIGILPGEYKII